MRDKRTSHDEVIAELRDGMTIGIGGWGSRRKPMSLVRALLRSPVTDLTVVSYGGPDVGLLCAAGKVKRLITGFVSLDSIPLEPHYRAAREKGYARGGEGQGTSAEGGLGEGKEGEPSRTGPRGSSPPERAGIDTAELDEGMLQWGLYAAALRLPFLPTRAGLGSDVLPLNPWLRTVTSPYDDGETLVAVPALELDVALVHMNRADAAGNAQFLGPDLYFDDLFLGAAKKRFVSTEKVVATEELLAGGSLHTLRIHRGMVDGVVEARLGAHFTECPPDYGRDEAFQKRYAQAAADPAAWGAFADQFLSGTHDDYVRAVEALR